ncbi:MULTISPECIES: RNA polymerase sigma factor [Sphingobacterium]|uniref:RNA polymerase sigma-70 factor n=1 Tax=Sphingobacterium ginsenosidimutans TaxID=687845 RepID=A0ABP7ZWL5_9SPHI|nr:RNA polymerase sigma-70 factor [Sphingobacterium sp. E70]ULT23459.1 RNA polymerase sigma-70 factor [Sphingobacterium sp. E70]
MNNQPHSSHLSTLFEKINQGDKQAFNEFYSCYASRLLNFAKQMLADADTAEEIVSDLFVQIWTKRAIIRDIQKPQLYLYKSLKNSCLNEIRKNANTTQTIDNELEERTAAQTPSPLDALIDKELHAILTEAVNSLPIQRKVIFTLIREDGLKQKEVAELLDISLRTVENQLYRAVKYLSNYIEVYWKKEQSIMNKPNFKRFLLSLF